MHRADREDRLATTNGCLLSGASISASRIVKVVAPSPQRAVRVSPSETARTVQRSKVAAVMGIGEWLHAGGPGGGYIDHSRLTTDCDSLAGAGTPKLLIYIG